LRRKPAPVSRSAMCLRRYEAKRDQYFALPSTQAE
jgi:hypothetical protein